MKINDSRKQFTLNTFSNRKKSLVIKELEKSIYYHKNEDALFYTYDLLCSGFLIELWNCYIHILCKYIHIHNPKITIYIQKKFIEFKTILEKCNSDLEIRDIEEAQIIFTSITLILCESNKDTILESMKFIFNFDEIFTNLKAPNVNFIQPYFKDGDPKEIYIPINELAYHIFETKQKQEIFYWIEWILEYDYKLQKNKKGIKCIKRSFVNSKIQNVVWIIWELFLTFDKKPILHKILLSLLDLFSIKYTPQSNFKKKDILLFASMLIIHQDHIDFDKKILENTETFKNINENINKIFQQLKKYEMIE